MPRPADKTHSHNWVNCRYHYIVYSALIAHVYLPSLNIKTMLSKVKLVEDIYMCTTYYAKHLWVVDTGKPTEKVSALYLLHWPMINSIGFVLLCHLLLVLPEFLPHARKCPSIRISAWGKTIGTKTEKKGLKILNSSICAFRLLLKECCQTGCNFPVKLNQINPFPPHRRLVAPSDTSIMVRLHFSELASPDPLFPDLPEVPWFVLFLLFEIEAIWQYEGGKFEEIRGSEAFTSEVNVFNMQPTQVFSGVTMRGWGVRYTSIIPNRGNLNICHFFFLV